jgi:CheY-like chemotaxis protein
VNSTPGHGSTFEVLLPRHQAGESVATARSGPARQLEIANGEVILLAEDEPVVRKLTATILTRLGYRVLVAEDGTAALTLARAHEGRIDLLLTDVVMPSMNGRELAERIVAERPGTPVLFMSGYTEDPTLKQAIADERVAFLDKPFTAAQLSARVRDVMSAPAIARA